VTTQNLYVPQEGQLSDLTDWLAGDLGSAYARLYTNNPVYLPTNDCGDYVEAAFAGYVPANPLGWGSPFINASEEAEVDSGALTWTYSVGSGSQYVFGIYVTDAAKSKLLLVIPFLTPFQFTPAQDSLSYVIQATAASQL
jgi:hypothetical protein